jgi:hypothetical protein
LREWASEQPDTANGVVAVLDLAAMITADASKDPYLEASLITRRSAISPMRCR